MHVAVNSIWLLPFGAAMARRFGAVRFLAFFAVTAIAGAALHLVTHWGELLPMIGASAAVSGMMAGSLRFIFQAGGPLAMFRTADEAAYRVPAAPLSVALPEFAHRHFPGGVVRAQPPVRDRIDELSRGRAGRRLAGPYRRFPRRARPVRVVRSDTAADRVRSDLRGLSARTLHRTRCAAPAFTFSILLLPRKRGERMMGARKASPRRDVTGSK